MLQNNIKIFLSSDDNYAPFVAITIASICAKTESFCEFYILDGGISEENQKRIFKLKNRFNNFTIEFLKIDLGEVFKTLNYQNKLNHVSISTYNRFLISQLKPEIDRAIYLDVDVIALGDIRTLWEQDLNGKTVGLIPDEGENDLIIQFKEKFSLTNYYNAGVLLVDLIKWKEKNYSKSAFKFEEQNRENLNFADQDIINVLVKDDCTNLDSIYNVQLKSNERTVIRHFSNIYKPWKYNYFKLGNSIKPLADFDNFWGIAKMTDFYEDLKTGYEKNINSNMLIKRLSIIAEKMNNKVEV